MDYNQIHEIENINLLEKLIDESGLDPNAYDKYGLTPLHYCTTKPVAEFLIRKGADPLKVSNDGRSLSPTETCSNEDILITLAKNMVNKI